MSLFSLSISLGCLDSMYLLTHRLLQLLPFPAFLLVLPRRCWGQPLLPWHLFHCPPLMFWHLWMPPIPLPTWWYVFVSHLWSLLLPLPLLYSGCLGLRMLSALGPHPI